jgi:glycosyltransferase involved in cell wall biosynthesis
MTSSDVTAAARPTSPAALRPRSRADAIVVASVPADHVYVRHLSPEDGPGPIRLPDPDPGGGTAVTQRWWPPKMLDPAWVETHDFDVFHLHFGFDSRSVAELEALVAALRLRGKPLVFTVHDLRNPHHEERDTHDRQLDVLVPGADALITLTRGAAAEIRSRWGREATVLPHPHVVPLDVMRRVAAMRDVRRRGGRAREFRVGVHVKSLRAGMHPHPVIPVLVEALRDIPGAVLQVNGHRDVLSPGGARYDAGLARMLRNHADRGEIDLRIHDYFDDDALWSYLASLDASVVPYRFGTHSGWLEACRDLGTTVVAPTCGYFADQGPVLSYGHDENGLDVAGLTAAVRAAYHGQAAEPPSVEDRRRQRAALAAAHARIYEKLVDGAR